MKWEKLIIIATRHHNRLRAANNKRYDRQSVYSIKSIGQLAIELYGVGELKGSTKNFKLLSVMEASAIKIFKAKHGIYHNEK